MPSFASHIVVAKLVREKLHLKYTLSYYQGTVFPDLIDEKNHYKKEEQEMCIPVPFEYMKKQKKVGFFELGYYIHLLLDEIYLKEFVLMNNEHPADMFLNQTIYKDYSFLHQKLCHDFHISSHWLNSLLAMKNPEIEEEKRERHHTYINTQITETEFYYFNYSNYVTFLKYAANKIVDIIMSDIENERIELKYNCYMTLKPRILRHINQKKLSNSYYLWEKRIVKIVELPDYSVIQMFEIFNYPNRKDLISVDENMYVQNNCLNVVPLILEGTDGVGKSTIGENLLIQGIVCQDRSEDIICKYMLFEVDESVRKKEIEQYLIMHPNMKFVFLVLDDERELKRRIYSRKKISSYDEQAYEYNRLYEKTYQQLKHLSNLYLVDCKDKSIEEITQEIVQIIS